MEFEKKIAVLGSTGSIGTQTLEIAREYKGIKIEAMSAHSNVNLIEKQAVAISALQEENKENIIFHHFAAKNLQGGSQIVFHRLFGEIQLFGYLLDGDMFLPA